MSIAEMQACLARLYTDDSFRKLFYLDQTTLQEYRLTEDESDAIKNIDQEKLAYFAKSLKNKRRKIIQRAYPLIFALDSNTINRLYDRYYQLHIVEPDQNYLQDILKFGTFMEESLAYAENLPPYVSDLAKYERLYYWAKFTLTSNAYLSTNHSDLNSQLKLTNMDLCPSLCKDIQIVKFKYNVIEIEEFVKNDKSLNKLEFQKGEYFFVFAPGESILNPKFLSLSATTITLLNLCNGNRTLLQIVNQIEEMFGANNLYDSIVEAIERLLALQVIVYPLNKSR